MADIIPRCVQLDHDELARLIMPSGKSVWDSRAKEISSERTETGIKVLPSGFGQSLHPVHEKLLDRTVDGIFHDRILSNGAVGHAVPRQLAVPDLHLVTVKRNCPLPSTNHG